MEVLIIVVWGEVMHSRPIVCICKLLIEKEKKVRVCIIMRDDVSFFVSYL